MRFSRNRYSRCKDCPLRDCPRVWGEGADDPKIALIGEAPGAEEEVTGKPFVGMAGRKLNWALGSVGIRRSRVWATNVISCRPPKNDLSSYEGMEAIKCCAFGFQEELKNLKKRGVRVLVPLGNYALTAVELEPGIFKYRGSIFQKNGQVILPTFHPSFINRGMQKHEPTWLADLEKARILSEKKYKPPKENFNLFPTLGDVEDFTRDCIHNHRLVSIDIETTSLRPDLAEIVVIGLATNGETVLSVPLLKKGGRCYWGRERGKVISLLRRLLEYCPTMYQNALFDVAHLQYHGFEVRNIHEDTLLAHHCLSGDTIINTLEGPKEIRELKEKKDFWIVSHDGKKLVPKRAKVCWKVGIRNDLLRVTFWSKSRVDKSKMWIDCTPEHEFPVQGKGKVRAKDLEPGDRLYRGQSRATLIDKKRIHRWVWESAHGGSLGDLHIHHIDGNHWNNTPDNLLPVTEGLHQCYHRNNRYRATIVMQKNARERLYRELDPNEVYHLYFEVGLSYREVAKELGVYFDRVRSVFRAKGWKGRSKSEATRLRWEKGKNCRVISVTPLRGAYEVYDIEVPETHTFSANGIVVGNSIHPELPHSIGYIVSIYGATPYWKEGILRRDSSILEVEDEKLRTYNARDAATLHQVLPGLLSDAREFDVLSTYRNISIPLIPPVLEMQAHGILLSKSKLAYYRGKYRKEMDLLEKEIKAGANLPPCFNLASGEDLRLLIYGEEGSKFKRAKKELSEYEKEGTRRKKNSAKYRELKELEEVSKIAPFSLPPSSGRRKRTPCGVSSVDEEALLRIAINANARSVLISRFKRPTREHRKEKQELEVLKKWIAGYLKWKELQKILSTYMNFPVRADGRVHFPYRIHGTKTGRLASGDTKGTGEPNAQNIPKDVRKVFIAEEGNIIIECDYCLSPETKVLKSDLTWVPVGTVKAGDELIGFEEQLRSQTKLLPSVVEATRTLTAPCFRIITDRGVVVASADHQWAVTPRDNVYRRWIRTEDLQKGHKISFFCDPWDVDISWEGGYLAGLFDAEGSINDHTIGFGQNPGEVWDRTVAYLYGKGFEFGTGNGSNKCRQLWLRGEKPGIRFLGMVRPPRLLERAREMWEGARTWGKRSKPAVVNKIEYLGEQEVVATRTSTRTIIAEGMLSHNSNLELRVLAYVSNDDVLISTFEEGKNVHDINTHDLFQIGRDNPKWEAARRAAKIYIFGRNYGGGLQGIFRRVALKVPELGLTFAQFKKVDERYRRNHPRYVVWAARTIRKVEDASALRNAFGRQRIFLGTKHEKEKEGLNFPIQSTASDIINMALISFYKRRNEHGLKCKIIGQVHDSLLLEVPKEEKKKVTALLKECMEQEYTVNGHKVRFPVDMKYGKSWGEVK